MSDNYLGNPLLKSTNVKVNYTPDQLTEYIKCANDPVHFIENHIKIVSLDKGLVPFSMWQFQKNIINTIHGNRFTICKLPRQSGKSISVTSYLLHYCLFNPNVRVAILANKGDIAKDLLDRFKTSYQNLPRWLQQGIVEWNKFSVTLENGSRIISAATSSAAVRGGSYNIIVLDEFAYVPTNIANDFMSSVYPTISSGKSTKVVVISTPKGLNHFYKLWLNATNRKNSYIPIEAYWYDVPGRDQKFKEETIANTSELQWRTEFETEFIGSENTLIAPSTLARLTFAPAISSSKEGFDIYELPRKDHVYTISVDTSHGESLDYHAFTVVDCTAMPYRLVAKFRNNQISHQVYPHYIKQAAEQYNEAFVVLELNDLGQTVADLLHEELEYGNIVMVTGRGKKGQRADGGFGKGKPQMGVRSSYATKQIGCSVLKELIERDKLLICDFDTVSELSTYISKGNTYEATEGYNDDLVSSLVAFGWLTTQPYFKDYTNMDVRRRLYEAQIQKLEDSMLPFGLYSDGLSFDDDEEENSAIFDERTPEQRKKQHLDSYDELDFDSKT